MQCHFYCFKMAANKTISLYLHSYTTSFKKCLCCSCFIVMIQPLTLVFNTCIWGWPWIPDSPACQDFTLDPPDLYQTTILFWRLLPIEPSLPACNPASEDFKSRLPCGPDTLTTQLHRKVALQWGTNDNKLQIIFHSHDISTEQQSTVWRDSSFKSYLNLKIEREGSLSNVTKKPKQLERVLLNQSALTAAEE